MEFISFLIVAAALLVGVNIGANSAANAIGVIVGAEILSFRRAAFIVSLFMLAGALLQGGAVIKTVGSDLIPTTECGGEDVNYLEYDPRIALAALLAALIFVGAATLLSIPVATSHTMIGAIVGVLLAVGVAEGIDVAIFLKLILSWVITPFAAVVSAFLMYQHLMTPLLKKMDLLVFNRVFKLLLVLGAIFLSYSLGANNIGNAVGPLLGSKALSNQLVAVLLVGVSMGVGVAAFSRGVVETVGKKITTLGPTMAFTSQLAAAFVIYFFTLVGIPISSTQAVVGGVVGVGLTKGARTVNMKTIEYIFLGWILTPLVAGILSMALYLLISLI